MKKPRFNPRNPHARKVACTVSAAALMLGVSQAATVGFNFQANYCSSAGYSGAIVTAQAFGIAPSGWENLAQMNTGYSCGGICGFTMLNQTIDTNTSTGGLNPLPNGSLVVTWGAYAANVSGFGGYNRSGPYYTFGGNNEQPGNEQVYWGFLRDGVNFGPVPGSCNYSSGDNNQPGYNIDITGLKSLFTNSSFAVELIASSDSLWSLTNAFVIDATANSTQSVIYPSIPTPSDQGGSLTGGGSFQRGIGGGLSAASGAFNTDHLKIIGNRAQHTTTFNFASTICGFIITDQPIITMAPRQVLVCQGDTVAWSGYAVGVPPLAYQWRKNGVPIPGATTSAYGLTNVGLANIGSYDLRVTNSYGATLSSPVTIGDEVSATRISNLVLDTNPKGPQHNGLNHGATWVASSSDGSVTRTGLMSFTAGTPSQITVSGETNFDSSTGTIMFWMRSSGLVDAGGHSAALFDRLNKNGCLLSQTGDGTLEFDADVSGALDGTVITVTNVSDNHWHHIAVVYDQSPTGPLSGALTIYVDGHLDSSGSVGANWSFPAGQELEFGLSHDTNSWQAYNGLMDDVRFYNRGLTGAEITSAYGGALVDTNALVMQLNFTAAPGPGIILTWQAPDGILQSADSVKGPYTDVPGGASPHSVSVQQTAKFYRYRHTPVLVVSNPYLM
jgi:hypothetical protein